MEIAEINEDSLWKLQKLSRCFHPEKKVISELKSSKQSSRSIRIQQQQQPGFAYRKVSPCCL